MAHAIRRRHELDTIVDAVKREYDEMPGLALTLEQAQRLWALEPRMCQAALSRLVEAGYLRCTDGGHFTKPSVA